MSFGDENERDIIYCIKDISRINFYLSIALATNLSRIEYIHIVVLWSSYEFFSLFNFT